MSPQMEKILGEVQILLKDTDKFKNIKFNLNDTGVEKFNGKLKATRGSMSYFKDQLKRLESGRDNAWRTDQIERYNRMITKTRQNIEKMNVLHGKRSNLVPDKGGSGLGGEIGGFLQAGLAIGAAKQVFDFGMKAVMTGAKYEKYQAVLENTFGDRERAKFRMDELKNLSSATPFQISDWVESDIKLQNRGQNLNTGQLTNLGDLAASQGKGVDQLTEALLDAQGMEFERLKEFGIKASKEGDKVILNFKNQKVQIAANSDAITKAIIGMGQWKGVAGGMAKISKTTEGAISNLSDSYEQMMAAIGQSNSGPIKDLIGGLGSVTNTVKKWFEIPASQKLREEQGEMNALVSVSQDYTKTSEERNAALQQLQATYPEYFANITEEDVKLGRLQKTLDGINASYEKKIGLAAAKEMRTSNLDDKKTAENERNRIDLTTASYKMGGDDSFINKNLSFGERLLKIGYKISNPIGGEDSFKDFLKGRSYKLSKDITEYDAKEKEYKYNEDLALFRVYKEKFLFENDDLIEKLKGKDKKKFKALQTDFIMAMGANDKKKGLIDILSMGSEMDAILKGDNKLTGSGSSSGTGSETSAKSDAIIGGGAKPVNITVNISNMNGIENLTTNSSVKETSGNVQDAVMDAMLRAINGAVMMTGNNVR